MMHLACFKLVVPATQLSGRRWLQGCIIFHCQCRTAWGAIVASETGTVFKGIRSIRRHGLYVF